MANASECTLDLASLLDHESVQKSLRWSKSGAPVRRRQFIVFEGVGTSEVVGAFNNSIENCLAAILGRVLFRKFNGNYIPYREMIHVSGAFISLITCFNNDLEPILPMAAPIALDLFPGLYVGRKRRNYEQALKEFNEVGFKPSQAHIKMFLKYEKDVRTLKPERIPRVISPAGFVYLLLTGSYVKSVEERIYECVNELFGYKVVAKGVNYNTLANMIADNWNSYANCCSIDLDVSKMDQSITVEMLTWVHTIISKCFSSDERDYVFGLLSFSRRPIVKGRADNGKFKYKVIGTLTSGQMFTSLTGVLVVCGILYRFCKDNNLRLINCGDDCTLYGEKGDIKASYAKLEKLFLKAGMIVEIGKPQDSLEGSEFCQIRVVQDGTVYRSVRNVKAVLSKDSVCLDRIVVPHKLAAWCRSVAKGGLASFGGIPVLQNLYKCMLRSYDNFVCTAKLSKRQSKRMRQYEVSRDGQYAIWGFDLTHEFTECSDSMRLSFENAYGVSPVDQLLLEEYYDNLMINFVIPEEREVLETALSLFL